jgi:hypothetical protein
MQTEIRTRDNEEVRTITILVPSSGKEKSSYCIRFRKLPREWVPVEKFSGVKYTRLFSVDTTIIVTGPQSFIFYLLTTCFHLSWSSLGKSCYKVMTVITYGDTLIVNCFYVASIRVYLKWRRSWFVTVFNNFLFFLLASIDFSSSFFRTCQFQRLVKINLLSWRINIIDQNLFIYFLFCRFRWPRSLKRGSAAARLLGFRVRILPGAWISLSCECCVLSGRGLCDGPIPLPEEPYRGWCVWVWARNLNNEKA